IKKIAIKFIGYPGSVSTLSITITLKELDLFYKIEVLANIQSLKDEDFIANKYL
ncbi:23752_t:CDS:1, partial [Racocetra persica]